MNSALDDGKPDIWIFEVDGFDFTGVDGFDGEGVDSVVDYELSVWAKYSTVLANFSSSCLIMASCFSKEIRCSLFCCNWCLAVFSNPSILFFVVIGEGICKSVIVAFDIFDVWVKLV